MDGLPFSTVSQPLCALKTVLKDLCFNYYLKKKKSPFNKEIYMLRKKLGTEENS